MTRRREGEERARLCGVQAVERDRKGATGVATGGMSGRTQDASSGEYASERRRPEPTKCKFISRSAEQPVNTVTRNFCRRN